LRLNDLVSGLHVSAFAAGAIICALSVTRIERRLGRHRLLWIAVLGISLFSIALTLVPVAGLTIASIVLMGFFGGLVLNTLQASLADRYGDQRTIALAEANVGASAANLILVGAFTLVAAVHLNWRLVIVGSLVLPLIMFLVNRKLPIANAPDAAASAQPRSGNQPGHLPRRFWLAAAMLFFTAMLEWSLASFGARFVEDVGNVTGNLAVTAMAGFFGGIFVARYTGSRLARAMSPVTIVTTSLIVTAIGFVVLLIAGNLALVIVGLAIAGLGTGNLFPIGFSIAMGLAPDHATIASSRVILAASAATLLAPITIGSLADALSIKTGMAIVAPIALAAAAVLLFLVARARRRAMSDAH
jgi:predicted MFS family arabinose efflux permease